jgi:hypothetical protein
LVPVGAVWECEGFVKHWLRLVFWVCCIFWVATVRIAAAESGPFHNALSLQGFTGILNTPNAHVTDEGWVYALYTNQVESQWRSKTTSQDNYQFSLGFFNFIELGGRFIEAPGSARDLSGNLKLTSAPLTRNLPLVPVLGLGIQDLGGGNALLKTTYLVLSEDIWRLRLSAGYGKGPDRMKGGFAGAEFKAHDWVYLLGDYDTKETNLGARVVLPQFWKVPVQFTATAKTSLNYKPGNFDIAVGFTLPLDFRMRNRPRAAQHEAVAVNTGEPPFRTAAPATANGGPVVKQGAATAALPFAGRAGESGTGVVPQGVPSDTAVQLPASRPAADPESPAFRLGRLRDRLVGAGFLNVRVGTSGSTLVVEYENTIFNHNELDALGLVAGLASQTAPESFDTLQLVIKRRNLNIATVSVPLQSLREFLAGPQGSQNLRDRLKVDLSGREAADTVFLDGAKNSGLFNTSLMLGPGLTTFVGTENGAFDYLLSLKPELNTLLWKGGLLGARWDIPLSWSSNLEDGKPYRGNRHPAQLERLMLFQAAQPLPGVMLNLGAGMVVHDRYGMLNEAIWSPGDGQHRFRVVQGWNKDSNTQQKSDTYLGAYRYFYGPLDLSLEGVAGKFFSEDKGFSLELKRFWRDTAVSLYFKDTKGPDEKTWKAVGLQLSFPLTPRRDMKPIAKLQLRGADEWSYAQESTLKNNNENNPRGSLNYLAPYPLAINPQPAQALTRTFYNRDRLSESYILQHLERLREAWLKYGLSGNLEYK